MRRDNHVYRDVADGSTGTAGGGAAAGAGLSGTQAAGGSAGAGAAGTGTAAATALSAAAAAAGTQGQGTQGQQGFGGAAQVTDPFLAVPEKYRVMGADGKIDVTATFAKVDQARASLEQRMGDGGLPPAKPEDYKPDAVYAAVKEKTGKEMTLPPELLTDLGKRAHDLKLSQPQYEGMVSGLLEVIPNLVDQGFQHAMSTGTAELEKVWGADAKNPASPRMQSAWRAFERFAPAALRTTDTMDAIGNHPVVMQLLEAVGRELKSDRAPNDQGGAMTGVSRLDQIFADPAYMNAKDPRHPALVAEKDQLFARGMRPTFMQGKGGRTTL